jgi:hypothetical protein
MTFPILTIIVIGQIVAFQFLSIAFTRSLFVACLGTPAEPLSSELNDYLNKVRRYRFILGAALLLVVLAIVLGIPADSGVQKIVLAVVSVTSSAAFAMASIMDRRAARAMRDRLPGSERKVASLEPRSVSHWYHLVWEIVPAVILLATLAVTVAVGRRLGQPTTEMWVYQAFQAAFVMGAIFYTYRYGVTVPNTAARLAMLRDHPDVALEFGQRLAAKDMQYFMLAKIGVALLLGVNAVEAGLQALHHSAASILDSVSWVIVSILLVMFAAYVLTIVALTRHMQSQLRGGR